MAKPVDAFDIVVEESRFYRGFYVARFPDAVGYGPTPEDAKRELLISIIAECHAQLGQIPYTVPRITRAQYVAAVNGLSDGTARFGADGFLESTREDAT